MRKQCGMVMAALVLAGCGTTPTTGGWVSVGDRAASRRPAAPQGQARAAATTAQASVATDDDAVGGSATLGGARSVKRQSAHVSLTLGADAAAPVIVVDTLDASRGATAASGGNFVSAASGGVVRSADGSVAVIIPPGALTADAAVTVRPIATAGRPLAAFTLPGIAFELDLGGARIAPGTALKVTAPADPRLVDEARRRDPGFDPAAQGLSQDAAGAWQLTMPVNGPALMPVAPPVLAAGGGIGFTEYGALALPPGPAAGAIATRRLLAATEQAPAVSRSTEADCASFEQLVGFAVPGSADEVRRREGQGAFVCDAVHKTEWFSRVMDDLWADRKPCSAGGGQPPAAGPIAPVSVAVPAAVTYVSDDPALDGQPAAGARVRFDAPWTPLNGPSDVVADAAGRATGFTLGGLRVGLTPYLEGPAARSGETLEAVAAPGMAPVRLAIGNYSPRIVLDVTSDVPLTGSLTVRYTLDGQPGQLVLPLPSAVTAHQASFYVRVPSDADHRFELTGVSDAGWHEGSVPGTRPVRRNGTYRFAVSLTPPQPK